MASSPPPSQDKDSVRRRLFANVAESNRRIVRIDREIAALQRQRKDNEDFIRESVERLKETF